MRTTFFIFILLLASANAWAAAITSAQSGNWSSMSTWVGGVKPGAGDSAIVATGHTVTVDENTTVGSKAGAIGHAVAINATNSTTYGKLVVNSGVTLTLRGFDTTSNTLMFINRYAKFEPSPGSIILGDVASDGQSLIKNNGHLAAVGASGNHITFSVPVANTNWNNSATVDYAGTHGTMGVASAYSGSYVTATSTYDMIFGIGLNKITAGLENRIISNAAGSGIGSGTDTSFVLNSITNPTGGISTIKSSLVEITSHGDYFVDHQLGMLFHRVKGTGQTNGGINVTYKYLSFFGWGIISNADTTGSSAVFDYCDFSYMGAATYDKEFDANVAVGIRYKRSASVTADREGRIEHSTFTTCFHPIQIYDSYGNSTEKVKIRYNTFTGCMASYGANNFNKSLMGVGSFGNDTGYIDLSYNAWRSLSPMVLNDRISATYPLHDITMSYNTGDAPVGQYIPDGADNAVTDNTVAGLGTAGYLDSRGMSGQGTEGHPFVYARNINSRNHRAAVVGANVSITDNKFSESFHHGIVIGFANGHVKNVLIEKNIIYKTDYNDMPGGITFGYNTHTWSDSVVVRNNTFDNGHRSYLFGDEGESGVVYGTNVQVYNNIASNTYHGSRRDPATSATTANNKFNFGRFAKNTEFNFAVASNLRQCLPKIGADEYNLPATAKNISGVSIWNPSYTSFPVAAKNLQLLVGGTLGIDMAATLSWGGGTAVSLLNASGLAQGAVATAANTGSALGSKITVTGAGWPTTLKQLRGKLVLLTNGTVTIPAMIQNNTATELTLITNLNRNGAFALTGTPDIVTNPTTYKFIILDAEVSLSDGANTVTAGIDIARFSFTARTATDSITIEDGLITGDPQYANVAGGDFTPTNAALDNAGFDGVDIGAVTVGALDTTPPTTTVSVSAGRYQTKQSVALTAEPGATIKYCLTPGCTPIATYTEPVPVLKNIAYQVLRYSSTDGTNTETVKEQVFRKQKRK